MVGRGDDHGVDVLAVDDLAKVAVNVRLAAEELGIGRLDRRPRHVAQGGDFHAGLLQEELHHLAAAIARTDHAEADTVVGSQYTSGTQRAQPDGGGTGGFHEGSTVERHRHGGFSGMGKQERSPSISPAGPGQVKPWAWGAVRADTADTTGYSLRLPVTGLRSIEGEIGSATEGGAIFRFSALFVLEDVDRIGCGDCDIGNTIAIHISGQHEIADFTFARMVSRRRDRFESPWQRFRSVIPGNRTGRVHEEPRFPDIHLRSNLRACEIGSSLL